jgi:predicted PurR-regulated permease PerM
MQNYSRTIIIILAALLVLFLFWYFRSIVIYIAVAGVLSLLGEPIVNALNGIRIKNFKVGPSLSAALTLLLLLVVFISLIAAFIPLIFRQAETIMLLDPVNVLNNLMEPLMRSEFISNRFHDYLQYDTLRHYVHEKLLLFFDLARLTQIINTVAGLTGDFFIALFSISFITFFFLQDQSMLSRVILVLTPTAYQVKTEQVLKDSKYLLTRYFIGVCIQVLLIMSLITLGLTIVGVKNAFLIGFLAGLLNVIPYLGPLIGASFGIIIVVSTGLQFQTLSELTPLILQTGLVFIVVQVMDNIIFQPLIYSSSIKAHPLEIFLVIMIAGKVGGIGGIILAIPVYTIIRVIAKQFLNKFQAVRNLTDEIGSG